MPTYEGDPPVRNRLIMSIATGHPCNVTHLDMGAHTGTHVDAPVHFLDRAAGVDATPLDALIGPAYVVDATTVAGVLDRAALDGLAIPGDETRLLFKTTNSALWAGAGFSRAYVAFAEDAALALAARRPRLVGIDYLSVAPFGDPAPVHRALLGNDVVILEGLDLREVDPGRHELLCLPLRIVGCDGGPARVLLRPR